MSNGCQYRDSSNGCAIFFIMIMVALIMSAVGSIKKSVDRIEASMNIQVEKE